jgi:hypothetical protein
MTDRELLEAAYAAYRPGENYIRLVNDAGSDYWNPLADDGDALRLAVKLRSFPVIEFWSDGGLWVFMPGDEQNAELLGTDPYAATRRAIVRAAAEIGKEMK